MSSSPVPAISGLSELAPHYNAIFCDVWGVLIDGVRCYPGAAGALRAFRRQGGRVALITNASRPSAQVTLQQLDELGVPRDCWDAIVSAGELTLREIVARRGEACFHLGPAKDKGLFEAAAISSVRRHGSQAWKTPTTLFAPASSTTSATSRKTTTSVCEPCWTES